MVADLLDVREHLVARDLAVLLEEVPCILAEFGCFWRIPWHIFAAAPCQWFGDNNGHVGHVLWSYRARTAAKSFILKYGGDRYKARDVRIKVKLQCLTVQGIYLLSMRKET